MKKVLQSLAILTLLTWGGLFLYFYATGRIDRFLDPSFRIYALLAGIGMVLLGCFNFLNRNRDTGTCTHDHAHGETCDHDHHDHDHHDHDHSDSHDHSHAASHDHDHDHEETTSGLAFSILVLLVPLLIATGYSKDNFSDQYLTKWGKIERQMMQMRIAQSQPGPAPSLPTVDANDNPYTRDGIEGQQPTDADTPPSPDGEPAPTEEEPADDWGTFTLEDLKNMVPQNDAGEFLLDVPQIFYTAGDRELMQVMEGIPVETTAQLMEETMSNANGNRLKAFRLFIECCAADARPLSIPVEFGDGLPDYTEMGWYNLFGKLHYVEEEESILPIIKIERIEKTSEPMDGLLF